MTKTLTDKEILDVALEHCEFTPDGTYHLKKYAEWAIIRVVRECLELQSLVAAALEAKQPLGVDEHMALVDRYWSLAYDEGKEGRNHDTPDGAAQTTLSAIKASARALAAPQQAAPGFVMVPEVPTPEMRKAGGFESASCWANMIAARPLTAATSAPTEPVVDEREDWGPGPHENHWSKGVTDEQWEKAVRSLPLEREADDPLLGEALSLCVERGYTSISFVQRRLNIGYQRAGDLIATINKRGLIDAARATKETK